MFLTCFLHFGLLGSKRCCPIRSSAPVGGGRGLLLRPPPVQLDGQGRRPPDLGGLSTGDTECIGSGSGSGMGAGKVMARAK